MIGRILCKICMFVINRSEINKLLKIYLWRNSIERNVLHFKQTFYHFGSNFLFNNFNDKLD